MRNTLEFLGSSGVRKGEHVLFLTLYSGHVAKQPDGNWTRSLANLMLVGVLVRSDRDGNW